MKSVGSRRRRKKLAAGLFMMMLLKEGIVVTDFSLSLYQFRYSLFCLTQGFG